MYYLGGDFTLRRLDVLKREYLRFQTAKTLGVLQTPNLRSLRESPSLPAEPHFKGSRERGNALWRPQRLRAGGGDSARRRLSSREVGLGPAGTGLLGCAGGRRDVTAPRRAELHAGTRRGSSALAACCAATGAPASARAWVGGCSSSSGTAD